MKNSWRKKDFIINFTHPSLSEEDMKILHFEDDVYKHYDIAKAVEAAGSHEVIWVRNVEDGFARIREAEREGNPFQVIITDMHFPLSDGGEDSIRAGEEVLDGLEKRGLTIPVIICSSMNIRPSRAYGSVWYSKISDWDEELAAMIRELQRRAGN